VSLISRNHHETGLCFSALGFGGAKNRFMTSGYYNTPIHSMPFW